MSIHSGLNLVYLTSDPGGWSSVGFRLFLECQKEIVRNWYYGYSYEGMVPLNIKEFKPLTHFVSLSIYYKINLYKDRISFVPGIGLGAVHHYGNYNEFGLAANASLILSIRVLKNIYLELPPLILTPPPRIYYSPLGFKRDNHLLALTDCAFGIKIRL